jgi:hypothetical protein
MLGLQPPRHISTLPIATTARREDKCAVVVTGLATVSIGQIERGLGLTLLRAPQ